MVFKENENKEKNWGVGSRRLEGESTSDTDLGTIEGSSASKLSGLTSPSKLNFGRPKASTALPLRHLNWKGKILKDAQNDLSPANITVYISTKIMIIR